MENYRSNPTTNKLLRATQNTQGRASKEVNKTTVTKGSKLTNHALEQMGGGTSQNPRFIK